MNLFMKFGKAPYDWLNFQDRRPINLRMPIYISDSGIQNVKQSALYQIQAQAELVCFCSFSHSCDYRTYIKINKNIL